ncbi:TPA: hypothetical protein EYP38_02905 [Candidatus Micrarchaeota archaeon]|nr:hypothetical protein [Candidatus Micrarchaeota archaeon]
MGKGVIVIPTIFVGSGQDSKRVPDKHRTAGREGPMGGCPGIPKVKLHNAVDEMMSAASGCPFNSRVRSAILARLKDVEEGPGKFGQELREAKGNDHEAYVRMVKAFARQIIGIEKKNWKKGKFD